MPTTAGTYTTAIDAGDGTYSAEDLLTWTVAPHIAITVPANQNSAIGDSVSVTVSATDVRRPPSASAPRVSQPA